MYKRIIPTLLLDANGFYKTRFFKNPSYVGDPVNIIRIFNEKEVDEVNIIDIGLSKKNNPLNLKLIENIASESFMPMSYGGGILSLEDAEKIFSFGIEKISFNQAIFHNPKLIRECSKRFGAQSIVANVNLKKDFFKRLRLFDYKLNKLYKKNFSEYFDYLKLLGFGEIYLNIVDREGSLLGPDIEIADEFLKLSSLPMVYNGGISSINDIKSIFDLGFDAVSAGAFFIYSGPHRAVLISYPQADKLLKCGVKLYKGN